MRHGTRQLSDKRARHGAWRPATGLVLRRHVDGFYSAVDSPEAGARRQDDEKIGTVTADGAYDTCRCHTAIIDWQATPIIPIRKSGRLWKADCPAARSRNETLRATRHYGRAFWKRWTGYHARNPIEARMRCLKSFGEHIAARDPDRQTAEIHIRIALMNRFNALGNAEIIRVA